jgi:PKD repeat protein
VTLAVMRHTRVGRVRVLAASLGAVLLGAAVAGPAAGALARAAGSPGYPPTCSTAAQLSPRAGARGIPSQGEGPDGPSCLQDYITGNYNRKGGAPWGTLGNKALVSSVLTVTASSGTSLALGSPMTFQLHTSLPSCDQQLPEHTLCWVDPEVEVSRYLPVTGARPDLALTTPSGAPLSQCAGSLTCTVTPQVGTSGNQPLAGHWIVVYATVQVVEWRNAPLAYQDDWVGRAYAETALKTGTSSLQPSFTVTAFGDGQYQYGSTTPQPSDGSALSYLWDFGDGVTAPGGVTSAHTYTKPGTYTVTLQVTSSSGDSGTVSQQVVVAAPKLGVSVTFPTASFYSPPPQPDVGDTLEVQVDVSASDGVGNLSHIEFLGAPLQIAPAATLSVLDGPTPVPPPVFSLPPNGEAVFDFHVKAQKLGTATLSSQVTAVDDAGTTQQASGRQSVQVGKAIVVVVTAAPSPITVPKDSNDDPIPQPLAVTVSVTNPLRVPLDVTLGKPPAVQHLQASENLDPIQLDASKKLPQLHVGIVSPRQTRQVAFAYLAVNDGAAALDWPVTAPNPDDPNATLTGVGHVEVIVNPTYLLDVNLSTVPAGAVLKAGQPFDVSLAIKNVTNSAVVHLDPIKPVLTGNAGGGNPFDVDKPPRPASLAIAPGTPVPATECNPSPSAGGTVAHPDDTYVLPWSGTLAAGAPVALWGVVQTVPNGPARAALTYHLTGTVELKDGTTRPLTDQDVRMAPGDGTVSQVLDASSPVPVPADFTSFAGNFGLGMIRGTCEFFRSTFDSVAWVLRSGFAVVNPRTYGEGALKLYQAIEYGKNWYASLTPAQKDSWVSEASTIIWDQTADKAKTTYAAVKTAVNGEAETFFSGLIGAWDTGDMNKVADTMGDITANTSLQVLTFLIPEADVVSLAERNAGAQAAGQAIKDASALEDGLNLTKDVPAALPEVYGMPEVQAAGTSALAVDKNILIAVRSRHPLSDRLIKLYDAVTKPASIAVKTVNDIDVTFLGYDAADTGLVVLFQPDHAAVVAAAAKLPPDVQGLVLARLAQREDEWTQYLAKYQGYAKPFDQGGGIQVEFDWKGNGISTQPNPNAGPLKSFDLSNVGADGTPRPANYFLPRIADASGTLRVITGDVDVVGIVEATGRAIQSVKERIDIYKNLMQIIDMQHPETLTWFKGGTKQVDLLTNHVGPNAERLAVFGPDGNAFTASIDAHLTTFDANNALLGVWFDGAYKSAAALNYHYADVAAAIVQNTVKALTNNYVSATSWFVSTANKPSPVPTHSMGRGTGRIVLVAAELPRAPLPPSSGDNHGMLGYCPWHFSAARTAKVLYTDRNGGLLQWSPGSRAWTSYDSGACTAGGSHHAIGLLPQTALSLPAATGVRTVSIYGLSAVDPTRVRSTPWFSAGEQVVIDPGQPNQETARVKTASPLTLDRPLRYAHAAGAMVSVARGRAGGSHVVLYLLALAILLIVLSLLVRVRMTRR